MKAFCAVLLILSLSSLAKASPDFPFTIVRDQSGKISRIELPSQNSLATNDNLLTLLRTELGSSSEASALQADGALGTDEQRVFLKAKASLLNNLSLSELNSPLLDQEFTKALPKLNDIKVYRLLASPYQANAFDKENTVKEVVEEVLAAAKKSIQGPTFEVFEFLVDQTLESLESRREFHQNRLLYWLNQEPSLFNDEERGAIISSIFYSRLGVLDFINKRRAEGAWKSYGVSQFQTLMKKCDGFASTNSNHFGACFKTEGLQVLNGLVKRSNWSKGPSIAFDSQKPYSVRNTRITLILLKLALKFVPGPGFAKDGVRSWLDSQYLSQRRSEGLLYEAARFQQQDDLAAWVLVESANPLIIPNQL